MSNVEGFSTQRAVEQLDQIHRASSIAGEIVATQAVGIFPAEFPVEGEKAKAYVEQLGVQRKQFVLDILDTSVPSLESLASFVRKDLFLQSSRSLNSLNSAGQTQVLDVLCEIPLSLRIFYVIKRAAEEKRSFGFDRLAELACEPELVKETMSNKDALNAVKGGVRVVRGVVEQNGGSLENQGSSRAALLKLKLPADPETEGSIEGALTHRQREKNIRLNQEVVLGDSPLALIAGLRREGFLTREEIQQFRKISGRRVETVGDEDQFSEVQQSIIDLVRKQPGITRQEIESDTGVSAQNLTYHLSRIRAKLSEADSGFTIYTDRKYQEAASYFWMSNEEIEGYEAKQKSLESDFFGEDGVRPHFDPEKQKEQLMAIRKGKHALAYLRQLADGNDHFAQRLKEFSGLGLAKYSKRIDELDADIVALGEEELIQAIEDAKKNLEALVLGSSGLVLRAVAHTPYKDYRDAVNSGLFGLMQAAVQYDDQDFISGFAGFATMRISGAIIDEMRKNDPLSRATRQNLNKVDRAVQELWSQNGTYPTAQEIADAAGISIRAVVEVVNRQSSVSLDAPRYTERSRERYESIAGFDPSPEQQIVDFENEDEIRKAMLAGITKLPERERQILKLYYADSLTMKEIAQELSISESRVAQLHGRAIGMLRNGFAS